MNAMMLDLETMGKRPDAAIVQIGACIFDIVTAKIHHVFEVNIDLEDAMREGLSADASTIQFWLKQPHRNWMEGVSTSLEKALLRFHGWEREFNFGPEDFQGEEYRYKNVWCRMNFDAPIIQNAFDAVDMVSPLKYNDFRDLSTLRDLADYQRPVHPGTPHDALEDCRYQVNQCVEALNRLKK